MATDVRTTERLDRFTSAQDQPHGGFATALDEIRAGRKSSHWIWYVFPQLAGLGGSPMAQAYAIADRQEAAAYLRDPLLRQRLFTIAAAAAEQLTGGTRVDRLMGSSIDALKLVSSMTLFGAIARDLWASERLDGCDALAEAADQILQVAESQGYPPCAYTTAHIARAR